MVPRLEVVTLRPTRPNTQQPRNNHVSLLLILRRQEINIVHLSIVFLHWGECSRSTRSAGSFGGGKTPPVPSGLARATCILQRPCRWIEEVLEATQEQQRNGSSPVSLITMILHCLPCLSSSSSFLPFLSLSLSPSPSLSPSLSKPLTFLCFSISAPPTYLAPTASCAVSMRNKEGLSADTTNTSVCGDDVLDCDVAHQSHVSAHLFPSSPITCESLGASCFAPH